MFPDVKRCIQEKNHMHFRDKFQLSWLVFTLCLILNVIAESPADGFKNFSGSTKFNHLVVDKDRGWVFIGAVNRIYQLSTELNLIENFATGLRECNKPKCPDNYNKILVMDYNCSRLLSCGSYPLGLCDMYEIKDRLHKINTPTYPVITSGPNTSTVAFIAPFTSKSFWKFWEGKKSFPALYVGVTYIHESEVPAIATRSLKEDKFLQTFTSSTEISFNDNFRGKYFVNYVYGFSSGSYSYFLTTQMNSTQSSSYTSKLIRICQQDHHYNSYTEIPIECIDKFGQAYNLVQAAYIAKPSSDLAKSLDVASHDDVLFGIFSPSKESLGNESNKPLDKSALCVYSIKAINEKFSENIQNCYRGMGDRGLEYILSPSDRKCYKTSFSDSNFCGKIYNLPYGGNLPVQATAATTVDTLLTAITTVLRYDFTILITGTHSGHLKAIAMKNTTAVWNWKEVVIDEASSVNADLLIDSKEEFVYAMTDHKLTRIEIRNFLPFISDFKPKKGPWGDGFNVTIKVDNFDDLFKDSHFDIKVAGIPCIPHTYNSSSKEIVCITNNYSEPKSREGPVNLLVNGIPVSSDTKFTFVDLKIDKFFPKEGPLFGGTELTIEGEHLDFGNPIDVLIGNISCVVFSLNSTFLKCLTSSSPTPMEANITVKIDNGIRTFNDSFNYFSDANRDRNGYNRTPKGILAGGIVILIKAEDLNPSQKLILRVYNENSTYNMLCEIKNSSTAICFSPHISDISNNSIDPDNPLRFNCSLVAVDENEAPAQISFRDGKYTTFLLYPNPIFETFSVAVLERSVYFIINGQNIDNACQKPDFKVLVGNNICKLSGIAKKKLFCYVPQNEIFDFRNSSDEFVLPVYENITVLIGNNFTQIVYNESKVIANKTINNQINTSTTDTSSAYLLSIGIISSAFVICLIVALCYVYRRKYSQSANSKKMREEMNKLQLCVAAECKEAFAELQTEMTNLPAQNLIDGLPFLNYSTYVMKNLFPCMENHFQFLNETTAPVKKPGTINPLDDLIKNKTFLLIFVRTLENNENFSMTNRVFFASLLMITLHNDMDYCTDIIETLLADLISEYTETKKHPKLLLRGTESVVEKMLSIWFTFTLHKFLRECAGDPLFKLFSAMKQHINKGPVDMITSEARYSLNQEKLLRHCVDYHTITVNINVPQQTADIIGLKSALEMVPLSVLDCDTITQVKEKVLDIIFGTAGYSKYPNVFEFELKYMTGPTEGKILYDNDFSSKIEGEWKQKNTLLHYKVPEGAVFTLLSHKQMRHRTSSISLDEYPPKIPDPRPRPSLKSQCIKEQIPGSEIPLIRDNEAYFKEWHLVKPYNPDNDGSDYYIDYKLVSEIYLTRVLATKSTLQRFVDDLFKTILTKNHQMSCFPISIKYMFDFLDHQAVQHGITDPDVVHTWKSNCLPLRFWVNLIKNPNFLFDVHKSNIIDSCLSVVAQAFMDSCSTADQHLGKDSPTSRLLYAKDIPFYKEWVEKYYSDIRAMPAVSRKQLKVMFTKELQPYFYDFNTDASIYELHTFMKLYKNEIVVALKEDTVSQKSLLANKFEKVIEILENY